MILMNECFRKHMVILAKEKQEKNQELQLMAALKNGLLT